ncbi:hypothetical protein PG985_000065 [Apiospora marii]|uniref:Uncharacterized protein n=1 Tax=Apiospora marii TaxID=335849 RepID=A0ABR1QZV9_9PEZI
MSKYGGEPAGFVSVSKDVIESMICARQQNPSVAGESYATLKFQMVPTIAHDIISLFVEFLADFERATTPCNVSMPDYKLNDSTGEAGRYWERIFLGGVVEDSSTKYHVTRRQLHP